MGRHSAPDSDEADLPAADVAATAVIAPGRHAGSDTADTGSDTAAETPTAPVRIAELHPGTRGDLHLLRHSRALRVRCAAAVIVPFVVYTALLIGLARTDVYLIWLWIPTVLAGVLVGAFLDAAHRRLRSAPPHQPAAEQSVDHD